MRGLKQVKGFGVEEEQSAMKMQALFRGHQTRKEIQAKRTRTEVGDDGTMVDPQLDPKDSARNYVVKHKIITLFETLAARIFYHNPENPREFLCEELKKLQAAKEKNKDAQLVLLNEEDLRTIFSLMDLENKGAVSKFRCQDVATNLELPDAITSRFNDELITENRFVVIMKDGLKKMNRLFNNKGLNATQFEDEDESEGEAEGEEVEGEDANDTQEPAEEAGEAAAEDAGGEEAEETPQ